MYIKLAVLVTGEKRLQTFGKEERKPKRLAESSWGKTHKAIFLQFYSELLGWDVKWEVYVQSAQKVTWMQTYG